MVPVSIVQHTLIQTRTEDFVPLLLATKAGKSLMQIEIAFNANTISTQMRTVQNAFKIPATTRQKF